MIALAQAAMDYERIERALMFMDEHIADGLRLGDVARAVNLPEAHFERLILRWAGTTPDRFLRYLSKEYAKHLLDKSLPEAARESGLSGPGRLHDLFVTHETFTPVEYRRGAAGLEVRYGIAPTPFGPCLICATGRGLTDLVFTGGAGEDPLARVRAELPRAAFKEDRELAADYARRIFGGKPLSAPVHLLLRGTAFQIEVWETLLRIPFGGAACYEEIARLAGRPQARRAVGAAVGANRLAYLIPCHRVIRKLGATGGYRWGIHRKRAMLAWEAARSEALLQGAAARVLGERRG